MQRDAKADLAKLEAFIGDLGKIHTEVTDLLIAGGDRAEVLLSQLDTVTKTARDYLPVARDLAAGAEERQQAAGAYLTRTYAGPKRDAV